MKYWFTQKLGHTGYSGIKLDYWDTDVAPGYGISIHIVFFYKWFWLILDNYLFDNNHKMLSTTNMNLMKTSQFIVIVGQPTWFLLHHVDYFHQLERQPEKTLNQLKPNIIFFLLQEIK